jgi:hypothetical protein
VLGKFDAHERAEMADAVARAADATECWIRHGIDEAMNRYNAVPKDRDVPPRAAGERGAGTGGRGARRGGARQDGERHAPPAGGRDAEGEPR